MRQLLYLYLLLFVAACASSPAPVQPEKTQAPAKTEPPLPQIIKAKPSARLAAVGDIFLGGTSTPTLQKEGYNHPFAATKALLADSDIVIGNLEGPLTSRGSPAQNKRYVFRTPANKVAPALAAAGFNIVTLANNHTVDYGIEGLSDTITALDKESIAHIGAGETLNEARKAHIMDINGLKVGFLGYSLTFPEEFWADKTHGGTAFAREEELRADMKSLRPLADVIVVSFHWGREAQTTLRPYQERMGHIAIDEGASLIIGHHPHIMQAVEQYKNGLILYSLGNYTFGSFTNRVQYGGIANIELDGDGFKSLAISIIDINNFRQFFQPKLMKGKGLKAALGQVKQLSEQRHTELVIKGDKLILHRQPLLHQHLQ